MKKLFITATVSAIFFSALNAVAGELATKDECVVKCHEAAALINSKGVEAAIGMIGAPTGPF